MKRVLTFLLLCAAYTCLAQPTLDECQELAGKNYPTIRQYDLIAKSESFSLANVSRQWIPQVTLSAQATWQSDVPSYPEQMVGMLEAQGVEMPGLQKDQYKILLDVNQPIWDGGRAKANKQIAKADAVANRSSADVDMYALKNTIDNLYFGILLLDERAEQVQTMINLLDSNLCKVRSMVRNGVAMQSDADEIEAEKITMEQQLSQIRISDQNSRKMLGLFIGQEIGENALQRPADIDVSTDGNVRPEEMLLNAQISKLSAQEQLVKSSGMPNVSLFAQCFYGYPGFDYFESMMSTDWSLGALVGVRASWNISSLYTRKNTVQNLKVAQEQLVVQKDVFTFNNSLQVEKQNSEIEQLRNAIANDDKLVELRTSIRRTAESKLNNGVINTTDLLRKITDETSAKMTRSSHEIELLQKLYNLKHSTNQ